MIPLPGNYLIHGYLGSAYATLACYAVMMVLGYLIGQRYYPVNYNLRKFFGYFGLAFGIYLLHEYIKPVSTLADLLLALALLILFLGVVWRVEKPGFLKAA